MPDKRLILALANVTDPPAQFAARLVILRRRAKAYAVLAFNGYDSDEREVWQVPEIQAWCRAFVEAGGLSSIMPVEEWPADQDHPGMLRHEIVLTAGLPGVTYKTAGPVGHDLQCDLNAVRDLELKYRPPLPEVN